MSSRGTSRYGRDAAGTWGRDDEGLPCYDWDLRRLGRAVPSWPHLLGTGQLQVMADQWGCVRLLAGSAADRLSVNAAAPGCISALRLDLQVAGRNLRLLPLVAPSAWQPQVRYGCGYVAYGLSVQGDGIPLRLGLHIDLMACPGKPFVLAEIAVRPGEGEHEPLACVLTVASDVGTLGTANAPAAPLFARDGAAMMSLGLGRGDAFLAGSSGWDSAAFPGRLELRRSLTLRPREAVSMRLLLGYSDSSSLQWLRQQFDGLTTEAVRGRQTAVLQSAAVSAPELWMREDLTWCRSALSAFQAPEALTKRTVLHPTSGSAPPRTAHLLALCPFLQQAFPEVVRDTLVAVALRQGSEGQFPETLDGPLPGFRADPGRDRSDTEVGFLLACARWLAQPEQEALLETRLPEGKPHAPTLAERIMLAAARVREGIGSGSHGLVRLLAGDWSGALDRAGQAGGGESVLTTAQYAAALRDLAGILRRTGRREAAERLDGWQRESAAAVGDAFRGGVFLRGYSDAGEAFGDPATGPVFLDVQAWAVLARCGTVSQRREAVDHILAACGTGPLTVLTSPYPAAWPAAISRFAIPPGDGLNAGIALLEAAWFLQALAVEGRTAEALSHYQELSLRRRCAADDRPPLPAVLRAARLNGPAALAAFWWPATVPAVDAAPEAAAVAWQEQTLRAILTPSPGA